MSASAFRTSVYRYSLASSATPQSGDKSSNIADRHLCMPTIQPKYLHRHMSVESTDEKYNPLISNRRGSRCGLGCRGNRRCHRSDKTPNVFPFGARIDSGSKGRRAVRVLAPRPGGFLRINRLGRLMPRALPCPPFLDATDSTEVEASPVRCGRGRPRKEGGEREANGRAARGGPERAIRKEVREARAEWRQARSEIKAMEDRHLGSVDKGRQPNSDGCEAYECGERG